MYNLSRDTFIRSESYLPNLTNGGGDIIIKRSIINLVLCMRFFAHYLSFTCGLHDWENWTFADPSKEEEEEEKNSSQ